MNKHEEAERRIAEMRLRDAAPDLLAALKAMMHDHETVGFKTNPIVEHLARAAIAKAESKR